MSLGESRLPHRIYLRHMTCLQHRAFWAVRSGLIALLILFLLQLLPIPVIPQAYFDSAPIVAVAEFVVRHQWSYVATIVGAAGIWPISQYRSARSSADRWILAGSVVCAFLFFVFSILSWVHPGLSSSVNLLSKINAIAFAVLLSASFCRVRRLRRE